MGDLGLERYGGGQMQMSLTTRIGKTIYAVMWWSGIGHLRIKKWWFYNSISLNCVLKQFSAFFTTQKMPITVICQLFAWSFRFQRGKTRKMIRYRRWIEFNWIVTQLEDLSPVYWDLGIGHLFPTSREHRNIVQLCTNWLPTDLWEHDVKRSLCVD